MTPKGQCVVQGISEPQKAFSVRRSVFKGGQVARVVQGVTAVRLSNFLQPLQPASFGPH